MGHLEGILGAVLSGAGGRAGAPQQGARPQMPSQSSGTGGADPLDGLLEAILGGNPAVQQHSQNTGTAIDDILGGLTGGVQPQPPQVPSGGQGGMCDILGQILGAAQGQSSKVPRMPGGGQGGMGDILGQILGAAQGQTSQSPRLPNGGQGGMGDILGQILGATQGQSSQASRMPQGQSDLGPLGGILSSVIAGGIGGGGDLKSIAAGVAANAFLAPIVKKIADRLGLPPAVAQAIVAFAVSKLIAGAAENRQIAPAGHAPQPQSAGAPNINDILQSLGNGQRVDRRTIKQMGLADDLAGQAEIDPTTAARGLQAVFDEFSTTMVSGSEQTDVSSLLSKWLPAQQ